MLPPSANSNANCFINWSLGLSPFLALVSSRQNTELSGVYLFPLSTRSKLPVAADPTYRELEDRLAQCNVRGRMRKV